MQVFVVYTDPDLPSLVEDSDQYRLEASTNQPPSIRPASPMHGRSGVDQIIHIAQEAVAFVDQHEWTVAALGGFLEFLRRTHKKFKVRIENTKGLSREELQMIRGIGPEVMVIEEDDDVSFR